MKKIEMEKMEKIQGGYDPCIAYLDILLRYGYVEGVVNLFWKYCAVEA